MMRYAAHYNDVATNPKFFVEFTFEVQKKTHFLHLFLPRFS